MKRFRRTLVLILTACILAGGAALHVKAVPMNLSGGENRPLSVNPMTETDGYSAVLYDNTNGLPTSEANAIAQTSEGFLWIGSYSGLVRYDGNTFERMDSTNGLANVKRLYTDQKDRLWIGTNDHGVFMMERGTFRNWDRPEGLKSSAIRAIAEDPDGNIYVASTRGIVRITPEMELCPLDDPRIADVFMQEMRTGSDGLLYCVSNNGDLFTLKNGQVVRFMDHESCPLSGIGCIYPDPERPGYLYMETEQEIVYRGNFEEGFPVLDEIDVAPLSQVQSFEYIDGDLWICARNGIGVIRDDVFRKLENVPMNNSIGSIMTDHEGNLWFTSTRQGVMKIVPNQFLSLYTRFNLPENVVNSTCLLGDLLFVATDSGLTVLSDQGPVADVPLKSAKTAGGMDLQADNLVEFLDGVRIRSIIRDREGRLWLSTWRRYGLLRYDQGVLTAFTEEDGMLSDRIRAVSEREDGSILAAVTGGVNVIEGDRVVRSFSTESGIVNTEILTVCPGKDGDILAGSDGDGIYIIGAEETRRIGTEEGLLSEAVMRLKPDKARGVTWIVTGNSIGYLDADYGLHVIRKFPYSNNFDLYENSRGEMWILSSNGIYAASVDELLKNEDIHPVHYGMANGLSCITTANSYSELTEDGDLYIAGNNGVVRFNIERPFENITGLKAAVPYVDADGERIYPDESGAFVLPKRTRKLTIYAHVFNYSLIDPLVSCSLQGFDKNETGMSRSELGPMDYTNLPGGNYRFVMRISDSMGRGSRTIEIPIVKKKALYEQLWFFITLGILTAGLIVLGVRLYIRRRIRLLEKKHAEEQERERIGTELDMAGRIQESTLPHEFPPYPDRREFDIYASMDPAREVGGDFYDFFLIDEDHLALEIADVSGKGIPASLFMMVSKALLKNGAMTGRSPAEVLMHTNATLCSNNQMEMFVTVWLGILEISTGKLTCANAGHEYPAVKMPNRPFELLKDPHGFVLGGFDDETYTDYTLQLEPGSKIFV